MRTMGTSVAVSIAGRGRVECVEDRNRGGSVLSSSTDRTEHRS